MCQAKNCGGGCQTDAPAKGFAKRSNVVHVLFGLVAEIVVVRAVFTHIFVFVDVVHIFGGLRTVEVVRRQRGAIHCDGVASAQMVVPTAEKVLLENRYRELLPIFIYLVRLE